jgi:hypothetical protein
LKCGRFGIFDPQGLFSRFPAPVLERAARLACPSSRSIAQTSLALLMKRWIEPATSPRTLKEPRSKTAPNRYPIGVLGRRNALGDLFVSRLIACPESDFLTAIDNLLTAINHLKETKEEDSRAAFPSLRRTLQRKWRI